MKFLTLQASAGLLLLAEVQALTLPLVPMKRQDDNSHVPVDEPSLYLTSYATEDIIATTETVKVSTSVAPSGTVQILPTLSDVEPHTEGVVNSQIETETQGPLMTKPIPSPTSLLQPLDLKSTTKQKREPTPVAHELEERQATTEIFAVPVATSTPPSVFKRRTDHPVPRTDIIRITGPLHSNKFYTNFFMGDQTGPVYTFPYSLWWSKGKGATASYGLAISHTEARQRNWGPLESTGANKYFINPNGIQYFVMSAKELGPTTKLETDEVTAFSCRINLRNPGRTAAIRFPIVQGMPFVTGQYINSTPMFQSGVYFRSMTKLATFHRANITKYNFVLEDGSTWRLYGYHTDGQPLDLKVANNGLAQSSRRFTGYIQVTKDPKTTGSEAIFDDGAGQFPSTLALTGSASGTTGTYNFRYTRNGHARGNIYMYALPHHVASFNADTKSRVLATQLQTGTKGIATLVKGTLWTMVESALPTNMDWAPWDASKGSRKTLSTAAKNAIRQIAQIEISQDMNAQTNLESVYFAGKALLKFAHIVYALNDLVGDTALAQAGLVKLKVAFARWSSNSQRWPLTYESAWGGLVSTATYSNGNQGLDFGNTIYNDHHFHYGYHILTAAFIGYLDPAWATANKAYVNTLVRDIANPSTKDTWFPQYRNFDWYHGHSWAAGLKAALDGKDQESSSEDIMAAYALKMWGTVIGDSAMVSRANIQLAVQRRSMQSYYLYTADNKIQPAAFIGNKVAGILFENKIDHTIWFEGGFEAIQGIHMIPLHAPSGLQRSKTFVQEEWNAYYSNGRVDAIKNGWKGIAYANYAIIQPKASFDFFNQTNFNAAWIDGGASRTWYMAYAAALGGL